MLLVVERESSDARVTETENVVFDVRDVKLKVRLEVPLKDSDRLEFPKAIPTVGSELDVVVCKTEFKKT